MDFLLLEMGGKKQRVECQGTKDLSIETCVPSWQYSTAVVQKLLYLVCTLRWAQSEIVPLY